MIKIEFSREILLKISFNIYHYDTLINFIRAFPELKDLILNGIGFFSLSKIVTKSKDNRLENAGSSSKTCFLEKWLESNFDKIENLNYYPSLLRNDYSNEKNMRPPNHYIGSYGIRLFQKTVNNEYLSSMSYCLSQFFGYPKQRNANDLSFNYSFDFLYSIMTSLSKTFLGSIIHKYKLYYSSNDHSIINKSINLEIQEQNHDYTRYIDTNIYFKGLDGFGSLFNTGRFREEILKIVELKKFRFFVLILNIPISSIEYDTMMMLQQFMHHPSKYQEREYEVIPFNIISYKSFDSDLPFQLLDSGDCLTNNHISLLDQISRVKMTRTLPHEITFDFFDLNQKCFEFKPSPSARDAMSRNRAIKMRDKLWIQKGLLSDIPGLISFQVILSRNIEEFYNKTTSSWGPFRCKRTQKENKFNLKEDIESFQPSTSIFKSMELFNKKFNLERLQKTYDELFTSKQREIQELINQIPEYESTKSYTSFLYKWREKSDETYEVRQKRLELIWKRIDLFQEFLYHLPWVRGEILEPSLQIKLNLFIKKNK